MNKSKIRRLLSPLLPVLDVLLSPLTFLASLLLFVIRKLKVSKMPVSKKIFKWVGVFPISNHYYEPLFDDTQLNHPLESERELPGIEWNTKGQLELLRQFQYMEELAAFPIRSHNNHQTFFFDNPSLGPGDAEYLYCMIRHFKPSKIIEIGSGYSTLMAIAATQKNKAEQPALETKTICIEPYEMPWLEETGVEVIRKRVEDLEASFFRSLDENDILFIDSSHIIRPQGDVLFELLELLPTLRKGVIIHLHDIFSPRDYTKLVVVDEVLFWNEQYMLEAFLTGNRDFEIIGAVNWLKNKYPELVKERLPWMKKFPEHEPGSFWIRKIA